MALLGLLLAALLVASTSGNVYSACDSLQSDVAVPGLPYVAEWALDGAAALFPAFAPLTTSYTVVASDSAGDGAGIGITVDASHVYNASEDSVLVSNVNATPSIHIVLDASPAALSLTVLRNGTNASLSFVDARVTYALAVERNASNALLAAIDVSSADVVPSFCPLVADYAWLLPFNESTGSVTARPWSVNGTVVSAVNASLTDISWSGNGTANVALANIPTNSTAGVVSVTFSVDAPDAAQALGPVQRTYVVRVGRRGDPDVSLGNVTTTSGNVVLSADEIRVVLAGRDAQPTIQVAANGAHAVILSPGSETFFPLAPTSLPFSGLGTRLVTLGPLGSRAPAGGESLTIPLVIVAQDETVTRTVDLVLEQLVDVDATLQLLQMSSGERDYDFDVLSSSSGGSYLVDDMQANETHVTFLVVPTSPLASAVLLNGVAIVPGSPTVEAFLAPDTTVVWNVTVVAEDPSVSLAYIVRTVRASATDAGIASLAANVAVAFEPPFAANVTEYTIEPGADVLSIAFTVQPSHPYATVTVAGVAADAGVPSQTVALVGRETLVAIVVTAEDGTTTTTISVLVRRQVPRALASFVYSSMPPGTLEIPETRLWESQVFVRIELVDATFDDALAWTVSLQQAVANGVEALLTTEPRGWHAVMRPAIVAQANPVLPLSDSAVYVTVPAVPEYLIAFDEGISVTVPMAAVTGAFQDIVADTSLAVRNQGAVFSLALDSGGLATTEMAVRKHGVTIDVVVSHDRFVADPVVLLVSDADTNGGAVSSSGWAAVVAPLISSNNTSASETLMRIQVPPAPDFAIASVQRIRAVVEPSSVLSNGVPAADEDQGYLTIVNVAECGDGLVEAPESCDDGNAKAGDGCSESCKLEPGWLCALDGEPCVDVSVCGDRITSGRETCDDGNIFARDGCDPECRIELGWECTTATASAPTGSNCTDVSVCGDGRRESFEMCDDGAPTNRTGDGCDADCRVSFGWACAGLTPDVCGRTFPFATERPIAQAVPLTRSAMLTWLEPADPGGAAVTAYAIEYARASPAAVASPAPDATWESASAVEMVLAGVNATVLDQFAYFWPAATNTSEGRRRHALIKDLPPGMDTVFAVRAVNELGTSPQSRSSNRVRVETTCTDNCNWNGECPTDYFAAFCFCYNDWTGPTCADFRCPGNCTGNGYCSDGNYCVCQAGWKGDDCSEPSYTCPPDTSCGGRGTCLADGCVCEPGIGYGANCQYGYNVDASAETTNEAGDPIVLDIVFGARPLSSETVTMALAVSDATEAVVRPERIQLTNASPLLHQVTVSGLRDTVVDGAVPFNVTVGTPTSTIFDSPFLLLVPRNFSFATTDVPVWPAVQAVEPHQCTNNAETECTLTIRVDDVRPGVVVSVGGVRLADDAVTFDESRRRQPQESVLLVSFSGLELDNGFHDVAVRNTDGGNARLGDVLYMHRVCAQNGKLAKGGSCVSCPKGAVCPGGDRLFSDDGYYILPGTDEVWACDPPERCKAFGQCGAGYEGQFCGTCSDGYFSYDHQCQVCPSRGLAVGLLVFYTIAVLAVIATTLVASAEQLTHVMLCFLFVRHVGLAASVATAEASPWARPAFQLLAVFAVDISAIPVACLGVRFGILEHLWFQVLVPVFAWPIVWFLLSAAACVAREAAAERLRARASGAITVLHHVFYWGIVHVCIQSIACARIDGVQYLLADMTIMCNRGEHTVTVFLAYAALVLLGFVFPIGLGVTFWLWRRRLVASDPLHLTFGWMFLGFDLDGKFSLFGLAALYEMAHGVAFGVWHRQPLVPLLIFLPIHLACFGVIVFRRPFLDPYHTLSGIVCESLVFFMAVLTAIDRVPAVLGAFGLIACLVVIGWLVLLAAIAASGRRPVDVLPNIDSLASPGEGETLDARRVDATTARTEAVDDLAGDVVVPSWNAASSVDDAPAGSASRPVVDRRRKSVVASMLTGVNYLLRGGEYSVEDVIEERFDLVYEDLLDPSQFDTHYNAVGGRDDVSTILLVQYIDSKRMYLDPWIRDYFGGAFDDRPPPAALNLREFRVLAHALWAKK